MDVGKDEPAFQLAASFPPSWQAQTGPFPIQSPIRPYSFASVITYKKAFQVQLSFAFAVFVPPPSLALCDRLAEDSALGSRTDDDAAR